MLCQLQGESEETIWHAQTIGDVLQQYWANSSQPWQFVPVKVFSDAFEQSKLGRGITEALGQPYQKPEGASEIDPLVRTR